MNRPPLVPHRLRRPPPTKATLRPLPLNDIKLVLLCSLAIPFSVYLAIAVVSPITVGRLLTVVATAYMATGVMTSAEALWALPRRRFKAKCEADDEAAIPEELPLLSAIIPAYLPNEQRIIVETVQHFLHSLAVPPDRFQLLVAYNTPVDLPVEGDLHRLASRDPRLRLLRVEGSRTKAENINAALPHLKGTYTAIFDADHRPEPLCFRKALRWLEAGYDVVQGRCVIRNRRQNWLTRLVGVEFSAMYSIAHPARSLGLDTAIFAGSNGFWRTEVLRALAMEPSMMTEDIDVSVRALLGGRRILHDRSILSTELAPETLSAWFHQRLRWAQGWHQVTLKWSPRLLSSPCLNRGQRLYWILLLPVREFFAAVLPQAMPMLMALVVLQVRFGGSWYWDPYLIATTVLTFFSGGLATLAAARHQRLAVTDHSWLDAVAYVVISPVVTWIQHTIIAVAWLRESRAQREWVPTPRSLPRAPVVDSLRPAAPTSDRLAPSSS